MEFFTINEVAKRLGISRQTLVRYEKKGILPKPRRNRINHWREYTHKDIQHMRRILIGGFTLIELVIVIMLLSILSVLVITRFDAFYAIKLNGAAKKIVSDIRYVQQLAIAQHEDYRMTFNIINDTYEVRRVSDSSFAKDPFTRQDMLVNFDTDPQYRDVDITAVNFGGTNALRFNWQGIPQDTNGNPLVAEGTISLVYRGNNNVIYVTPNTGRVRMQ